MTRIPSFSEEPNVNPACQVQKKHYRYKGLDPSAIYDISSIEMEAYMPARLRKRIRAAYETIRQLEPEVNPVKKILCVVSGFEAKAPHIDEIDEISTE